MYATNDVCIDVTSASKVLRFVSCSSDQALTKASAHRVAAAADRRAAQNRMDVDFGSFADVIHFGDYPAVVKRTHGQFLPVFTESEKALLKKSYDYFGVTQYTAKWSKENPDRPDGWWVRTEDSKGK